MDHRKSSTFISAYCLLDEDINQFKHEYLKRLKHHPRHLLALGSLVQRWLYHQHLNDGCMYVCMYVTNAVALRTQFGGRCIGMWGITLHIWKGNYL